MADYTLRARGKDFKRIMKNTEFLEDEALYDLNIKNGRLIDKYRMKAEIAFNLRGHLSFHEE